MLIYIYIYLLLSIYLSIYEDMYVKDSERISNLIVILQKKNCLAPIFQKENPCIE